MYIEKVFDLWVQLMKNGGKNKSVAFIILVSALENPNIEKITFKVVQITFLEMHITNQKLRFDIFTVGHLLNIFIDSWIFIFTKYPNDY